MTLRQGKKKSNRALFICKCFHLTKIIYLWNWNLKVWENKSERPVDALAVKTSLTDSVTDNLKSRDASASKKIIEQIIWWRFHLAEIKWVVFLNQEKNWTNVELCWFRDTSEFLKLSKILEIKPYTLFHLPLNTCNYEQQTVNWKKIHTFARWHFKNVI